MKDSSRSTSHHRNTTHNLNPTPCTKPIMGKRQQWISSSIIRAVFYDIQADNRSTVLLRILSFFSIFKLLLARFEAALFKKLRSEVWQLDEDEYHTSFSSAKSREGLKAVGDLGYSGSVYSLLLPYVLLTLTLFYSPSSRRPIPNSSSNLSHDRLSTHSSKQISSSHTQTTWWHIQTPFSFASPISCGLRTHLSVAFSGSHLAIIS